MKTKRRSKGLTVRAIAGTNTVLLGFDLADPSSGCLGFAIHRTDRSDGTTRWLRGMKVFKSIVPQPVRGEDYPSRVHPVQSFQWADYSAIPGRTYAYRVLALNGAPNALRVMHRVTLDVTTERNDDGRHGIWFNRGAAASQAFEKHFGQDRPLDDTDTEALAWLARDLDTAFVNFVGRANGPGWAVRGAFYEFTWARGARAFADAAATGADVRLVIHGRDKDSGTQDNDRTAAQARAAVDAAGIDQLVTWRTAPNKSALQHNKFVVLTHLGVPQAVWTGSTNLTQGGVFGHSNVGHTVTDNGVAAAFLAYWTVMANDAMTTAALRTWLATNNPVDTTVMPSASISAVLSPRHNDDVLAWYGRIFDSSTSSAHITGAFGLNPVFFPALTRQRPVIRNVLLDKAPSANQPQIPLVDDDVRLATGAKLNSPIAQWAAEHLTGFNTHVRYVHTKIVLVDPFTLRPTLLTGSANYSGNSTSANEENTLVVVGDERVGDIYLTEYYRIFIHLAARRYLQDAEPDDDPTWAFLTEDDSWATRYFEADSWRTHLRQLVAGTDNL